MLADAVDRASALAHDQSCAAQDGQGVVQPRVGAEVVPQHRVAADLGFLRVQDGGGVLQELGLGSALVAVEEFVGQKVRVPQPEVELLKLDLAPNDTECLIEGRQSLLGGTEWLAGTIDQQQDPDGVLLAAGRRTFSPSVRSVVIHRASVTACVCPDYGVPEVGCDRCPKLQLPLGPGSRRPAGREPSARRRQHPADRCGAAGRRRPRGAGWAAHGMGPRGPAPACAHACGGVPRQAQDLSRRGLTLLAPAADRYRFEHQPAPVRRLWQQSARTIGPWVSVSTPGRVRQGREGRSTGPGGPPAVGRTSRSAPGAASVRQCRPGHRRDRRPDAVRVVSSRGAARRRGRPGRRGRGGRRLQHPGHNGGRADLVERVAPARPGRRAGHEGAGQRGVHDRGVGQAGVVGGCDDGLARVRAGLFSRRGTLCRRARCASPARGRWRGWGAVGCRR